MTFEEILDQAIAMLQRRGRLTYGTLKRQFQLDDAALEDLKNELIEGQRLALDERGNVLVWTGSEIAPPHPSAFPTSSQDRTPLAYTPSYLAEKILTSRSAIEGERKQVTVLFADLKGSMELLAERDPEEARQLLDPVLQRMMEAVHRYEGTVNQVMGDGIMALFGAPLAHEDHAVRACYAALAMQDALRRYSDEVRRTHGVEMQIRVGLNSGEVVVRAIGNDLHMDYSAIGETTHLAARMEQLAPPGMIRLTAATLRLVEGFMRVNALGPIPVKGLTAPVEVFDLVGASALRHRIQAAAARGLTRFVGRDTELAALGQALARAAAGHGQVVALVGEAGVGKSRLVYECVHAHQTQSWLALESASVSYGKATPYFPVLDLLRRYARVDERDDTRTIRAKVTGQLLTLDETLQDAIPPLLALLDALPDDSPFLRLDPPQRRQRTLAALKRVVLRESQVQPVLVVFEDLHWIDSETQALLDSLVESLPTARLLLLVNYRPEYQHGWGGKTFYTQLRLDPLPPASAAEVLRALLGDDASLMPLTQRLIARTEGNPFFLEESVRTLVETGLLVGVPEAYLLVQPLDTFHVPATVQAVLAARIDRLPPEEKRLLQTAAVIGTEVPMPLLQAIAELPEAAFHHGLVHLQAAEFLYETRLFPEHAYTFKHALTHEVAYGGLLQERRRVLHARIVEVLEALAGDRVTEQVERLAYHALRGELWDKGLRYARQAGRRAVDHSAILQAAAYFDQALTALAHLPESHDTLEQTIESRLDRAQPHYMLGEFAQVLICTQEALRLAETLGDPYWLTRATVTQANSLWSVGDHVRALELAQQAATRAEALGNIPLQVVANLDLGQICNTLGNYRHGAAALGKSIALLQGDLAHERLGRAMYPAVTTRTNLARCLAELGEFGQATATAEESARIAEALQQPVSLLIAQVSVCVALLRQGAFHAAVTRLESVLAFFNTTALHAWYPWIASPLGYAYTMVQRCAEALPILDDVVARVTRSNHRYEALMLADLGEAYLHTGRQNDAQAIAERILALCRERGERGSETRALYLLGEIDAHRLPLAIEQAAAHYCQALALADELGMRPLQAHCHRGLGTLYAATGQQGQARAELATAVELYRAMEMTFWPPQTVAALAQVEG
jgi:predicted ATPase/class 3 adenylate cyclase